jgi:hypothetical protein
MKDKLAQNPMARFVYGFIAMGLIIAGAQLVHSTAGWVSTGVFVIFTGGVMFGYLVAIEPARKKKGNGQAS